MIELNLVPDIKREYIKAQRQRALAISVSIVVGLAAVGVVVLLGLLIGVQFARDKLARNAINDQNAKLQKVTDLSSMLTIQSQLSTLSSQNDSRTIDSRIFDVLSAINPPAPNNVQFSSVKLDPVAQTISLDGSADGGYAATDTLKKTILNSTFEYTKDSSSQKVPLTTNVAIVGTNYAQGSNGQQTLQFSLVLNYASDLFSNAITGAQINGPTGRHDVTDSATSVSESLFIAKPTPEGSN